LNLSLSLALAFTVGFFSSIHCFGMCGGIMGALSISLPEAERERPARLLGFILAYNTGRILIYLLLGLIVGFSGQLLGWGVGSDLWRQVAGGVAAITMILIGLYTTDWFPQLRQMDRLGGWLWQRLEPMGRRLLPIKRFSGAFVAGLVWGWLPCGLVYYALFLTLPLNSAWNSGIFMVIFGLGTLPAMLATGLFAGWMVHLGKIASLRQIAGIIIIILGVMTLIFGNDLTLQIPGDAAAVPDDNR
jgi:sulfite exporter TauE/SafE